MRRSLALLAIVALLLALLPARAVARSGAPAAEGPPAGPRIGLVTDGSALADKGFAEQAWAGVQVGAKAVHGTAQAIVPARDPAAYAWAIGWFVDHDYDVVITVGFLMADATLAAARANPAVQFFGIDQSVAAADAPRNYQRLVFDEAQAGYLAGIVAATVTATRTVGAVGGMPTAPVERFIRGYRSGVAAVVPSTTVLASYTGSFSRPDLGEESATGMIGTHADLVFGVAGATGLGVFAAACEAGVWAIGVDVDQYLEATAFQACILTSAEKRIATATSQAIERYVAGGLQGGEYVNDASTGGIGLAPIRNVKVPKGLADTLKKATAGLADGSIVP
jgi:basic membrane protein A and related proteins